MVTKYGITIFMDIFILNATHFFRAIDFLEERKMF